jgi:hypothetical protein
MSLTSAQRDDFAKYARNPDTWALAARRSLAVAKLLQTRVTELLRQPNRDFHEFSGCHYAGYFHAAMAVENALKAVLVSRDPTIVENGAVDIKRFGGKSGHALLGPAAVVFGPLTDEERHLLMKLEEYVWAGRYTVPTKADVLYDPDRMHNLRTGTADEASLLESLVGRAISSVSK